MTPEGTVRVAREGGRGWHFIAREKCEADPAGFVVVDENGKPVGGTFASAVLADLAALRAEYIARVGKKPFAGWKADELRKRMAETGA